MIARLRAYLGWLFDGFPQPDLLTWVRTHPAPVVHLVGLLLVAQFVRHIIASRRRPRAELFGMAKRFGADDAAVARRLEETGFPALNPETERVLNDLPELERTVRRNARGLS